MLDLVLFSFALRLLKLFLQSFHGIRDLFLNFRYLTLNLFKALLSLFLVLLGFVKLIFEAFADPFVRYFKLLNLYLLLGENLFFFKSIFLYFFNFSLYSCSLIYLLYDHFFHLGFEIILFLL